jgi:hypothetical protein
MDVNAGRGFVSISHLGAVQPSSSSRSPLASFPHQDEVTALINLTA